MTEPRMTHEQARDLAASYVLGALERSEEAAVRDHLATCAEPHPEFDAFGGVVPALLELADLELVEPPASLGARIMAAAAADLAEHPRAAAPAAPVTPAAPAAPEPPATIAFPTAAERADRETRSDRPRTSRLDWVLRIAAVVAIVAVGTWGLNLQRQLDQAQRFDRAVAAVVQAAGQPGSKTVILAAGKDVKSSGIGAVAADGSVVLAMRDLAATSGSQVYETWAILPNSNPVPLGSFTVDSSGVASFTSKQGPVGPGMAVAVSREPQAGATAPTEVVSVGVTTTPAS
jgi:anti-sigma-K factor RskA